MENQTWAGQVGYVNATYVLFVIFTYLSLKVTNKIHLNCILHVSALNG